MGDIERYYHQSAALIRVGELVEQGCNVWIRRGHLGYGAPVWIVEWTR